MNADAGWTVARFGAVRLDRRRRELSRDGVPQPLAPRAFDVLVALIEQRHRVVSKDDLIARCWRGEAGNDGALARVVMNLRRSIGDIGPIGDKTTAVIGTARGAGYRLDVDVELSDATPDPAPRPEQPTASAARLALLPLVNDTGDASLAWIELGLASMLAKSLESSHGIAVVALHEVLLATNGLPKDAPLERRVQTVRRQLAPDIVVCARMGGCAGHLVLRFELHRGSGEPRTGNIAGNDAATLAVQVGKRLAEWLLPDEAAGEATALDLGDPFLNETFARALHKSREGRQVEAAHLLDVVADSSVEHAGVQYELAKVHVDLATPRAAAKVEALRQSAQRADDAARLANAGLLASKLAWQRGDSQGAGAAAMQAAADAECAGLADLSLQCLIDAAHHLGQCFDPQAAALLSRAIPQAERLGNRVLMRHAYQTAGLVSCLRGDWVGGLRYQQAALEIANTMPEVTRGGTLMAVGRSLLHLGRLEESCSAGLEGFRYACISGSQPEVGAAAVTAAYACVYTGRVLDAAALFRQLQQRQDDRTVPMAVARDLLLRSTFLRLNGRMDEALVCIAATRDACLGHRIYETMCHVAEMRVLLNAKRFDELLALCARLRRSSPFADDPRLPAWVERVEALTDHVAYGRTEQAIGRLHTVVARLPRSEVQGRMALDLAWLHLERDEAALAEPLLPTLQGWLEQSGAGSLLQARLHHERGRFAAAVIEQRRFVEQYAQTLTPFTAKLLEIYERAAGSGSRQTIEPVALPLEFEYGLAPWIVQQLGRRSVRCDPCGTNDLRVALDVVLDQL